MIKLPSEANHNLMAGEEEDDYMGDVTQFLPPEFRQSSSNQACSLNSSNKKPKGQKWKEQRKLKRERKQIDEDQRTLENLASAIPESNIGFKLLKRMGYCPGSSLGKEGCGMTEPMGLEIRRGRAGIGKENPKVEKVKRVRQIAETRKRKEEELIVDFGSRQKERWKGRRIVVNYRKAEDALAQLENRDVEVEKKGDEDGEKEEEEEEEIMEEDLTNVLMKLRNEFRYCLFCGCQYETMDALMSDCPGINEDDH